MSLKLGLTVLENENRSNDAFDYEESSEKLRWQVKTLATVLIIYKCNIPDKKNETHTVAFYRLVYLFRFM